ncbi:death domain-associated 6 [Brachionus plicatilis]|uniref:Death domain-associated 6 n=1 Tax=Brachionus plicatilis TaxID=10195 RepID=A0A3M7SR89_BRAPC|nr:death domain-associated 6 [Brachionus plicatilis]
MSASKSKENNLDLLSIYKKHHTKSNKDSNLSQPDKVKASICYIQNLYRNSEIDSCDEEFKELVNKCKQAIETECKSLYFHLFYLAKFIKNFSKKKTELNKSLDSSDKENTNKEQNIENAEKSLAALIDETEENLLDGMQTEGSTTDLEPEIIEGSKKKTLSFTSVKSKRVTQIEHTTMDSNSDIQDTKKLIDSEKISDDLLTNDTEDLCEKKTSVDINFEKTKSAPENDAVNDDTELKDLSKEELKILENIKKLDAFCLELNEKIKENENREVALDELDSGRTIFIYEAKLKQRFVKAYSKLIWYCKKYPHLVSNEHKVVKGKNVIFSKKIKFDCTHFDEINSYITECLNKNREFPDFCEVLEWVKKASSVHHLDLEDKKIFEIAQISFEQICKILKSRRIADERQIHQSRIESIKTVQEKTDESIPELDPAENNQDLQAILENNQKIFEQKYKELVNTFVQKQEENQDAEDDEAEADEESEDDETRSETHTEENTDPNNLSLISEDYKLDSINNESSSSDSEDQIYGTPPENESVRKRLIEQSPDKQVKRIKLELNENSNKISDSNENLDSDEKPKKILPKIVECSSAIAEPEDCIVLD